MGKSSLGVQVLGRVALEPPHPAPRQDHIPCGKIWKPPRLPEGLPPLQTPQGAGGRSFSTESQAEPQAAPETPPLSRVHFPEGRVPGQLSFLSPGIWTGLSLGFGKEPCRVSCCPSGSIPTFQPEEGLRPEVQVTGELALHGNSEAPAPNWAGHK